MKTERAAAPAVGASLGYFLALYLTHQTAWIAEENLAQTVAFAGGICTYIVQEARNIFQWASSRNGEND